MGPGKRNKKRKGGKGEPNERGCRRFCRIPQPGTLIPSQSLDRSAVS